MKLVIYDFDGTYVNVQTVPHLFKLFKEKNIIKKRIRNSGVRLRAGIFYTS